MLVKDQVEGVVIGLILAIEHGAPLVVFPGNLSETAIQARSLTRFQPEDMGAEVAILFEDGDRTRPLIIGRIIDPQRADPQRPDTQRPETLRVVRDGEVVKINANERIELRVGKSSIVMDKDGHITIRGTHLVSHASASNRIRGGSVNLN